VKRTLIIIISFCIGILVGVTVTFLYQIWPAGPKVEKCRLDFLYEMPVELFDALIEVNT
jgi:hypothetical protein